VALACHGMPFNLGLLVGGLCGMMAGAELERRQTRAARSDTRTPADPETHA
jgi:hypothetical protein